MHSKRSRQIYLLLLLCFIGNQAHAQPDRRLSVGLQTGTFHLFDNGLSLPPNDPFQMSGLFASGRFSEHWGLRIGIGAWKLFSNSEYFAELGDTDAVFFRYNNVVAVSDCKFLDLNFVHTFFAGSRYF